MTDLRVGLIGNPNCGKTTLFNALTGARQKVGNWPGVTVEQRSGSFVISGNRIEVIDLPGIYSLEQESPAIDERIAGDYLRAGQYDLIVNIVDASNLQRSLVLTSQLQDLRLPMVVALNMLDVAEGQGVTVDPVKLATELVLPVVPLVASRRRGVDELLQVVAEQASNKEAPDMDIATNRIDIPVGYAGDTLVKRYHRANAIVGGAVRMAPVEHTVTEKIDAWALNRWLGVPVFLAMMYLTFTVAINLGAVFIDFFDILFGSLMVDIPRWMLESARAPAWVIVLLADGLGGGIQLVATFIPVIGVLFLCLSVLESSGYMSRAAFVADRLMVGVGLPGNAFVPLIVGFGCNVPAVMAARTMGRESDRLLTIAMAPFMSCGARLTVYALFAAALFPNNGQNLVFFLYLLGIAMAVLTGWLFRRQIFAGGLMPSFQEMPAYHLPVLRNILLTSWFRLKDFIFRAGKTIVLVVIGLSFLNSIGTDGSFGNEDSDRSMLAAVGKAITPVFKPIGLSDENWPATVGLFTGLFAKEAVVGTLDALYSGTEGAGEKGEVPSIIAAGLEAVLSVRDNATDLLGSLTDPLGIQLDEVSDIAEAAEHQSVEMATLTNMAQMFGTRFTAFCYLVFVLLYAPCVAVLGATAKEAGWKYMMLMFCWTTGLAYVSASCIYQIGTFAEHPVASGIWLVCAGAVSFISVRLLRGLGRKAVLSELIPVTQVS